MIEIIKAAEKGNERAKLALDLYIDGSGNISVPFLRCLEVSIV